LIVKSPSAVRVRELLQSYADRVQGDFQAYMPPRERPGA
jgi:hypothetical protein